jgi:hypothetical protein
MKCSAHDTASPATNFLVKEVSQENCYTVTYVGAFHPPYAHVVRGTAFHVSANYADLGVQCFAAG